MGKKKFTDKELIELHGQGLNDVEIAKRLRCSDTTVGNRRNKLGLKAHQKNKPKFTDKQLFEDINDDLTDAEIARKYKCSQVVVCLRRKKLGLPIKKALTDEDFIKVYNNKKFGTDKEMGKYLGYTIVTIRKKRQKLGLKPKRDANYRIEKRRKLNESIIELNSQGLDDYKIADKLGYYPCTISMLRRELKLPLIRKHTKKHIKSKSYQEIMINWICIKDEIMKLHGFGLNDYEIAEGLGISKSNLYNKRRSLRLKSNSSVKFTDKQLLDAVEDGLSNKEMIKRFKCCKQTIYSRKKMLGIPVRSICREEKVTISISKSVKNELNILKNKNETHCDVIRRLIDLECK